ncbi:MAG: hypothetical protein JWO11_1014 [Nocardioides sp.]|nr:hypothetical protein [Nocardioides sp.]
MSTSIRGKTSLRPQFNPRTSSEPPEPSELADPLQPNLGKRALEAGEPRVGSSIEATLQELRYPFPPAAVQAT